MILDDGGTATILVHLCVEYEVEITRVREYEQAREETPRI
jgi:hypothetical protein